MEQFFAERTLITLGVLIVDSRHKPTGEDVVMAEWFKASGCPAIVVANKCDKLKRSETKENLERIKSTLGFGPAVGLMPFSAEKGTGRDELLSAILGSAGLRV